MFRRDPGTGALTQEECIATPGGGTCGIARLESVWKFALTSDGRALVIAGDALITVPVNPDGRLGTPVAQKLRGTTAASAVAVSPDGATVYVATGVERSGRITALARDPQTNVLTSRGCAGDGGGVVSCRAAPGLADPTALAVSPDGRGVYAAASDWVSRDPANPFSPIGTQRSSALTAFAAPRLARRGCFLFTGRRSERPGCRRAPRARGAGFFGAAALAVAPSGHRVVAGFDKSGAVALLWRNARTQALRPLAGRAGCVRDAGRRPRVPRGCSAGHGIGAPSAIAIAPDGRNAYVIAPGRLSVLALG